MRKTILIVFLFLAEAASAQITYIGITNHNTGTGNNNLFNNYVSPGQTCYIDWDVYAEGMTIMESCGFRSRSRLILRRTADNDSTSVVASAPIIVAGTCGGKNGNNDHYYAELSTYIDKPGRYSVEIQADLPNATYPFENTSTRTTFNYACPSAYYLSGSGGTTGNYYTPAGQCAGGPGLSDPVGGQGTDTLAQIFTTQKFFTVGEAAAYREMILFNGNFYDLTHGKFQPGNPTFPLNLNGTNGIPAEGICPLIAAPALSIGGEVNIFKRTDCMEADCTGSQVFYRVYKEDILPPAFNSFNLTFKDDCSFSPNGPEGNIFPAGGSCQNANGIVDQRWQTVTGAGNILPAAFALSDTGWWRLECFTETQFKDCSGATFIQRSDTNRTAFSVNNPNRPGSSCAFVVPVIFSSFTVTNIAEKNVLQWKVEEADQVKRFDIQQSFNGYSFSTIGRVPYNNSSRQFSYNDNAYPGRTVYYRIVIYEENNRQLYSPVIRITGKEHAGQLLVQPAKGHLMATLTNAATASYTIKIINTTGRLIVSHHFSTASAGSTAFRIPLPSELPHGVYYAVLQRNMDNVVSRVNFYY